VQAVDDVHLGQRLVLPGAQLLEHLLEGHGVGAGISWLQPRERAEQAAGDANVGRLEPDVVVVVGAGTVPPFPFAVRESAHGEEIRCLEEAHTVFQVEPDAGFDLGGDILEASRRQSVMQALRHPDDLDAQ
jgi:hypothetical protein